MSSAPKDLSPENDDCSGITVGDLRRQLEVFPDDADLIIGGFKFYRLKSRGPLLVQVELRPHSYRSGDGFLVVEDDK